MLAVIAALLLFAFLALPRTPVIPTASLGSSESAPASLAGPERTVPPVASASKVQPTMTTPGATGPIATAAGLISGVASWYAWHPGEAAAGPALRRFLGSSWRGTVVRVCAKVCIRVRLTDFMRADRLIDLDSRSFAQL